MVQIVENHAEITGTLLSIAAVPERPGFVVLVIKVDTACSIGHWPNLLERNIGEIIEVLAREDGDVAGKEPGPVRLRVKKGGPTTIFAE